MKWNACMMVVAGLLLAAVTAAGADLTKIDRALGKEPAYKNKPKYCLLVFGPEAKSRVWLVLDGLTLYVDRNGNGDLTEGGERIKEEGSHPQTYEFRAGDLSLPGEKSLCKHLILRIHRYTLQGADRDALHLTITIDGKNWTGSFKEFSDRPQDAPLIPFNGPITLICPDPPIFVPGKTATLVINTGTRGLGKATFARRKANEIVGKDGRLLASIEYPNRDPAGKPLRTSFTLPLDECCGSTFEDLVRVPDMAGPGEARINLSFPDERGVLRATFLVPVTEATPKVIPSKSVEKTSRFSQPDARELESLRGTWTLATWKQDGKLLSPEQVRKLDMLGLTMTFQDDKVIHETPDWRRVYVYGVDTSKTPKEIAMELPSGDVLIGFWGIYKLEGDTLTFCSYGGPGERPRDFSVNPRRSTHVIEMRRQKKGR